MAENTIKLFGFEITRAKDKKTLASPVPPRDDDGSGYVTATSAGAHYGHSINMAGDAVIEKAGFKAYLPENSVYKDLRAQYKEAVMSKTASSLHQFGNSQTEVLTAGAANVTVTSTKVFSKR